MNINEQAIKDAFDQLYASGRYQYSDDNKANAYSWFRDGWLAMAAAIPPANTSQASDLIDARLEQYGYPANPKNAARAGYEAARFACCPL